MVIAALSTGGEGALPDEVTHLTPVELRAFAAEAAMQGVAPLLHARRGSRLPDGLLSDHYLQCAYRNLRIQHELREVVTAFGARDIPVVLLKGAHLALGVYHDPGVRPMVDIDLLVHPGDVDRGRFTLRDLGYAPESGTAPGVDSARHHHLPPFRASGRSPIELHFGLTHRSDRFPIDMRGLWSRVKSMRWRGADLLVLSPEDLILHLCLHAADGHGFLVPLLALCDIREVIGRVRGGLDWSELADIAHGDGRGPLTYTTLRLVQVMLGVDIPTGALDQLDHGLDEDEVVELVRYTLITEQPNVSTTQRRLAETQGWLRRGRMLLKAVRAHEWARRTPTPSADGDPSPTRVESRRSSLARLLRAKRVDPTWRASRRSIRRWLDGEPLGSSKSLRRDAVPGKSSL